MTDIRPTPSVVADEELVEREFLLLASYCGNDNPACTEARPCADCLAMCNVFDDKGAFIRELGAFAASDRDVLVGRIAETRESLRVTMLGQPTTGRRETYGDGFAMGLSEAIRRIDAALIALDEELSQGIAGTGTCFGQPAG